MLSWSITPAIESTFLRITPLSLKKELEVLSPAEPTN
jgi:hypothetical protein